MTNSDKIKIAFAPGVLEQLEAENTPEELQELFDQLKSQIEDGSFLENAEAVDLDELELNSPELYAELHEKLTELENPTAFKIPTLH